MSESKIEALVNAMTVEEQVSLLAGKDFWTTVPIERLGIPSIKVSDGPNGARGGGRFRRRDFGGGLSGRDRAGGVVEPGSRRRNRNRTRGRGALQGHARTPGANGKHSTLDAERPQFRVLFGGSFPHQRDRRRLYRRSAGATASLRRSSTSSETSRSTSATRSARTSTNALCARSICCRSRRR